MKRTYESEPATDDVSLRIHRWSSKEDDLLRKLAQESGGRITIRLVSDFQKFYDRSQSSIRGRWEQYLRDNREPKTQSIPKLPLNREEQVLIRRLKKLQSDAMSKHASQSTDNDRLSEPLSFGAMGDVKVMTKHARGSTDDDRLYQFLCSGAMGDARPIERIDSFFQGGACSGPISGVSLAQPLQVQVVQRQWTYDDDELLMNGFNMLLSFKQLSELLDRSVAECQSRSKLLIDKKGSVCSEGPTTSRLDGVPHYSIHVPSAASTQFFEEGDQGSVAAAPFPSSKAGLLGKHKAATGYDTGPSDERSTLPPALGGSFPQFDTGLHDFLADTEGLCGLDVFPAAGASSLSNEYGLLGPD